MKRFLFLITFCLFFAGGSSALAERMAVASPLANIRSGPGTTYDILWNIEQYHPLQIIEKSGSWYRFRDFEGDEGWIHKSLIRNIPTVITKEAKCHIRQGPGSSFKILFTVGRGIPFKIIEKKGNWLHIQHADGDTGWVHKSLVW